MRGLRRIGNFCRHGHTITDLEVRQILKVLSVDCLFARARLKHVARNLIKHPTTLTALLAARPRGKRMPWTELVLKDFDTIRSLVSTCSALPDPRSETAPWVELIRSTGKWRLSTSLLHFYESSCDRVAGTQFPCSHVASFKCRECPACFPTERARDSHARAKHGTRCHQRYFAPADGYA